LRTDTPVSTRPPFGRVLVANRGEIAVRVIRACRELGITPIAVYSDADADAPHVRAADLAERIGPPSPARSYLSIDAIIDAAKRSSADAIHPGYGFLYENVNFARAVTDAGLVFVGPPADAIEALGNKLAARRSAAAAGVPIVPGTTVALTDDLASLEGLHFPVMLKAAAGGGGRGMRRVDAPDRIAEAMAAARREAESAFGDGTIYVEQMVSPARHVEVQLLGDRHGNLAVLGERDCSVQRRHQKLVEESPSPGIDEATRAALLESARRVAGTVPFENAATVEFLVDAELNHYFLEMNTRLQVEHGVTELVTGLDLVAWQLRVAAGEELPPSVLDAPRRGHAIEVRIYAEDPYGGFRPTHGSIGAWVMPDGPGVRVDAATEPDMPLRPEYDPLLAKLMVHAEDRDAAVARLRRALDETLIGGLQTDAGFLRWLVDEPAFTSGGYDTSLIPARWYDRGAPLTGETMALAAFAALSVRKDSGPVARRPMASKDAGSAWGRLARREALRR
jgi:acetyl/propionyl-CoA carboxylase alpha subunit